MYGAWGTCLLCLRPCVQSLAYSKIKLLSMINLELVLYSALYNRLKIPYSLAVKNNYNIQLSPKYSILINLFFRSLQCSRSQGQSIPARGGRRVDLWHCKPSGLHHPSYGGVYNWGETVILSKAQPFPYRG